GGTSHSRAGETRAPGYRTASSRKIPVPHKRVSRSPRGRHATRRERSPGAPRSRGRAPCCWDPEVRRWPPLAPYEPPRPAGRERKCQKLPATILLICSVYKQKSRRGHAEETCGIHHFAAAVTLRYPHGGGGKREYVFPIRGSAVDVSFSPQCQAYCCGVWASHRRRGNGHRAARGPFASTQWGARALLGPAQHALGCVTREPLARASRPLSR